MTNHLPLTGILPDHHIRRLATEQDMISPFHERMSTGYTSGGLSFAGYDLTLSENYPPQIIDSIGSLDFSEPLTVEPTYHESADWTIRPGESALVRAKEFLRMPNHVAGLVVNKSTLARLFLIQPSTFIEPGWSGFLTIELMNHSFATVKLMPGMGVVQVIFFAMAEKPENDYGSNGGGKYQNQQAMMPLGS